MVPGLGPSFPRLNFGLSCGLDYAPSAAGFRWTFADPDISPGHPRLLASATVQPIQGCLVCAQIQIGVGLRGFWRVLGGHIGHARLANRMIYWLRQSSPICLAQSSAIIPRPDEISGLIFCIRRRTMKITAIKTSVCNAEMRNWIFVRVETD